MNPDSGDKAPLPNVRTEVQSGDTRAKSPPLRNAARRREKTKERGRCGPTEGKTSEAAMNYSCTISAYEATWKPFTVERSGYNTFYGSSHCKYPLFRRFEITAKHLPNTNLRGLADHKGTELTKRHLHIPPSCTRGLDNYLHFGTSTDLDLLSHPKSKFGCSLSFILELLPAIIGCEVAPNGVPSADRPPVCQRNAPKRLFLYA